MKGIITKNKAERDARNEKICAEYVRLRKMGGQKTPIYGRLAKIYGLKPFTVSCIVKKGGVR